MEYIELIQICRYMNQLLPIGIKVEEIEQIDKYKGYWNKKNKQIFYQGLKILKENNVKFIDIRRKIKSNDGKYNRINKRIKKMLKNKCWFCTWTIKEKNLNKNHTRKLKELYNGKNYIINCDYGTKTNRKHYHGIIESEEEPIKWEYGYCKFIEIEINEDATSKRISKYINKLTAHALKENTEKIIYSRTKKLK